MAEEHKEQASVKDKEPFWEELAETKLYGADPSCNHEIIELWSGIKCKKCKGWFCY